MPKRPKRCARKACGNRFEPKHPWQKYCDPGCSEIERMAKHWNKRRKEPSNV